MTTLITLNLSIEFVSPLRPDTVDDGFVKPFRSKDFSDGFVKPLQPKNRPYFWLQNVT